MSSLQHQILCIANFILCTLLIFISYRTNTIKSTRHRASHKYSHSSYKDNVTVAIKQVMYNMNMLLTLTKYRNAITVSSTRCKWKPDSVGLQRVLRCHGLIIGRFSTFGGVGNNRLRYGVGDQSEWRWVHWWHITHMHEGSCTVIATIVGLHPCHRNDPEWYGYSESMAQKREACTQLLGHIVCHLFLYFYV